MKNKDYNSIEFVYDTTNKKVYLQFCKNSSDEFHVVFDFEAFQEFSNNTIKLIKDINLQQLKEYQERTNGQAQLEAPKCQNS